MATTNVRSCLTRACDEIRAVCEEVPLEDDVERRLDAIETQLRYYTDPDASDPEAVARPDPDSLETIRDRLEAAISEADEETTVHLERACAELGRAIAVLDDRDATEGRVPGE